MDPCLCPHSACSSTSAPRDNPDRSPYQSRYLTPISDCRFPVESGCYTLTNSPNVLQVVGKSKRCHCKTNNLNILDLCLLQLCLFAACCYQLLSAFSVFTHQPAWVSFRCWCLSAVWKLMLWDALVNHAGSPEWERNPSWCNSSDVLKWQDQVLRQTQTG